MKTYQKFISEKKGDTVIFTFGRFNPPTVGHEKLITAVQSVAKSKGGDFFVYPSHSQDPKKNPLSQPQKIKYMRKMFPKHKKNIASSMGKNALDVAVEIYDKGSSSFTGWPSGYPIIISIIIKVFGFDEMIIRIFTILFSLILIYLIIKIKVLWMNLRDLF